METGAVVLMASSVATGLLGIVYWVVAEHLYPTAAVGRASAVLSTATMLSSLACLSLGGGYQRFLPVAGDRARRLVPAGLGLTIVVALVLGAGFVAVGAGGDRLFSGDLERGLFPLMVAGLAGYGLLDPVLIGLRRSAVVAAKNTAQSAAKLVALPVFAAGASALAISGSWVLLALLVSVGAYAVVRRETARRAGDPVALPPARQIAAFQGASFAMAAVLTVTPLCLPLVVLATLGPEHSAYYNLVAALATAAAMLRSNVLASYVVEASAPGADRAALTRRMTRLMALVSGGCAAGLAVGGPVLLRLVGPAYAAAATPLVLALAAETLLAGAVAAYAAIVQVTRQLRLLVLVQVEVVTVTVGGALLLVPREGLLGVGLASFGANALALALVAAPLARRLRAVPA